MKRYGLPIFIILTLSLALYANTLQNGFVYDDKDTILDNVLIKDMSNLPKLFTNEYFALSKEFSYRPVVTLTYFIDYRLFRLNSWGYHLTNILLHSLNCVILYILISFIFNERVKSQKFNFPFLITFIFISHPILSEAVNAISYREDLLVFFFYILTLNIYLFIDLKRESGLLTLVAAYLLSCLTYSFALFSKEMAVTLPLIIFCYKWFYKGNKRESSILFDRCNAGYIVITLLYGYIRFFYFNNSFEQVFYIPYHYCPIVN